MRRRKKKKAPGRIINPRHPSVVTLAAPRPAKALSARRQVLSNEGLSFAAEQYMQAPVAAGVLNRPESSASVPDGGEGRATNSRISKAVPSSRRAIAGFR